MYKTKFINSWGKEEFVSFKKGEYFNGNTAIIMMCEDPECYGEAYGNLTVNLGEKMPRPEYVYIDVNNIGTNIIEVLVNDGMISNPIKYERSGFVLYPLVKLNEKFINQIGEI